MTQQLMEAWHIVILHKHEGANLQMAMLLEVTHHRWQGLQIILNPPVPEMEQPLLLQVMQGGHLTSSNLRGSINMRVQPGR